MNPFDRLLVFIDPVLIAPYRLLADPLAAWWLGTFALALWAAFLGELTLSAAYRLNRAAVDKKSAEMTRYFKASINAGRAGDKESYKKINKLGNEAFGQSFFLQIAMGMGSLWPAFLAAGWLQLRFAEIKFALPFVDFNVGFIAPFIILYILARVLVSRTKMILFGKVAPAGGPQAGPLQSPDSD